MGAKDYRELDVWQQAMELVVAIYRVSDNLPHREQFGLCDQLRRAAVSIPSNIAEGFGRGTNKDFAHFLVLSRGSLYEAGTQLEIASRLGYVQMTDDVFSRMDSVARMLNAFIRKLKSSGANLPSPDAKHQAPGTMHQAP